MAPRPPPRLMDELIGEILRRLPPDEPENLVSAALVCKTWCGIVSHPAFRRGYREFHRAPPLLGFLHNPHHIYGTIPRFVPTAASPCSSPELGCLTWEALNSRHGRVLIHCFVPTGLVVWDPVTGDQQHLPLLPSHSYWFFTGAVLCAAARCNHLDCSGGPFRVVFVGTVEREGVHIMWASSYSSATGVWSAQTTINLTAYGYTTDDCVLYIDTRPSLLTGDALYFTLAQGMGILKYDLGGGNLSVLPGPYLPNAPEQPGIVMTAEDGGLGFAVILEWRLHMWSWVAGDNAAGRWGNWRIIELDTVLPTSVCAPWYIPNLIGFAEGTDTLVLKTHVGNFTLELKSRKTRKLGKGGHHYQVIPFVSFCTPDIAKGRFLLP